jgi:hypothetical protein
MKKFLVFLCAVTLVFSVVGSASALMLTNGSFVTPIPEPAIMFLLGTSLIGLATIGRKKLL